MRLLLYSGGGLLSQCCDRDACIVGMVVSANRMESHYCVAAAIAISHPQHYDHEDKRGSLLAKSIPLVSIDSRNDDAAITEKSRAALDLNPASLNTIACVFLIL